MDQYFFKTVFATSGDVATIPRASQPSGDMSYTDGFTSDYSLPNSDPSAKKVPRDQSNQLYKAIVENIQQYQTYGTPEWITAADNDAVAYSYSAGARVKYSGAVWVSLVDTNTAEPSTDATKWRLASTIETRGSSYGGIVAVTTTPYVILAANYGYQHIFSGSAAVATMPAIAGVNIGDSFNFVNQLNYPVTIARDGSSAFTGTNAINSTTTLVTVPPYSAVCITKDSSASWSVSGINANLGEQILAYGTPSNANAIDFALATLDPNVNDGNIYEVRLDGVQSDTGNETIRARFSIDNAATFISTSTYEWAQSGRSTWIGSLDNSEHTVAYGIVIGFASSADTSNLAATAGKVANSSMRLYCFNGITSRHAMLDFNSNWWNNAGSYAGKTTGFVGNGANGLYNGLRLYVSGSGTKFQAVGKYALVKLSRGV